MRVNILIAALFVFVAVSCQKQAKFITNTGRIYGTLYTIKYESPTGEDLQLDIEKEMNKLNRSLSTFDSLSVISKINRNEEVQPDNYFLTVFNRAMEISEITDGAFDITVAPMVNVWGFGFKNKENITEELIDSLKAITGYQKIMLENNKIVKEHPNTMLDCSAIAKGYACDVVGDFLNLKGSKNYLVEIGGEVVTKGRKQKGKNWVLGISKPNDDPFFANQQLKAHVKLENKALATSGNYRNFYIENGKKYAHTIDPKSGYPIQHSLLSATVLADDCMTADAFATAFMVLGIEKSIEIAESQKGLEVYFIYSDKNGGNKSWFSEGFKELLLKEFE